MIINSFSHASASEVSTLVEVGYIGDMNHVSSGSEGITEAWDGIVDTWNASALSVMGTADAIIGYDYVWSSSAGRKIDKIVIKGSTDHGMCVSNNPTDMDILAEGWNGSSWDSLGTTGAFTDSNSNVKTITSTDQVTLFTRVRVTISTATSSVKCAAQVEIHEVTAGLMQFNTIEGTFGDIPATWDLLEVAFDGVTDAPAGSSTATPANTSDGDLTVAFDTPRKVEKVLVYGSNNSGYCFTGNPTDVQIDLEGFNGSTWEALGDTGTFTDAASLIKTINSSDQSTLFEKVRVLISTATSTAKIIAEAEFYVLI